MPTVDLEASSKRVIRAYSKGQVMDWSLVLASQGISTTILECEEGWCLEVEPENYEEAREAIVKYRAENRDWTWRHNVPVLETVIHLGALGWCLLLILVHWITLQSLPEFRVGGGFDTLRVTQGEWWRAFTAVLLHADIGHLLANVTLGLLVWGLAMSRFGAGLGLLASYLAGAAANYIGLIFAIRPYYGLGASGMVMAALGLISAPSFSSRLIYRQGLRHLLRSAVGGLFIFLVVGVNPSSDVLAHAAGFGFGLLLGVTLNLTPASIWTKRPTTILVWLGLLSLLAWTCWLAIVNGARRVPSA